MPVLLVLFGVVFAVAALLGRKKSEPAEKPRPSWSDPGTPADRLAAPRHHSESHDDHFDADDS